MATYEILEQSPSVGGSKYITVLVSAAGQEFKQLLTSKLTGTALEQKLQSYADDYEAGLTALTDPPST